jgi:hypothetical protein
MMGFTNTLNLIAHSIYTLLITPIKWIFIALDININAPKQYSTSYSLNNPYSSNLMINVGEGQ